MRLYDEGETKGRGRFYSPVKVGQIRERNAAAEDARRQHQLTVRDKKLQLAILRAEKAHKVEERKQ